MSNHQVAKAVRQIRAVRRGRAEIKTSDIFLGFSIREARQSSRFRLSSFLRFRLLLGGALIVLFVLPSGPLAARCETFRLSPELKLELNKNTATISTSRAVDPLVDRLVNPPRLVVDLPGLIVTRGRTIPVTPGSAVADAGSSRKDELFGSARIGRHADRTRIVFDLISHVEPQDISVISEGNSIHVGARARNLVVSTGLNSDKIIAAQSNATRSNATRLIATAEIEITPEAAIVAARIPAAPPVSAIELSTPSSIPPTSIPESAPAEPPESIEEQTVVTPIVTPSDMAQAAVETDSEPSLQQKLDFGDSTTGEQEELSDEVGSKMGQFVSLSPRSLELKFSVSKMVVTFTSDMRPIADVVVKNRGDHPLFMTSNVKRLADPSVGDSPLVATTEVVSSPKKFELAPEDERAVRLLLNRSSDLDKESIYRVEIVPSAEPFESQNGRMVLNVATGIALLVIVEPRSPQPNLEWNWSEDGVTVRNTGNTNVLLERGQACGGKRCYALPIKRIYAGASWSIPVKPAKAEDLKSGDVTSLRFMQKIRDDFQPLVVRRN